jgi:hypothetical protein
VKADLAVSSLNANHFMTWLAVRPIPFFLAGECIAAWRSEKIPDKNVTDEEHLSRANKEVEAKLDKAKYGGL